MSTRSDYSTITLERCRGCGLDNVPYTAHWCRLCHDRWPTPIRRACDWGYPVSTEEPWANGQDDGLGDFESVNLEAYWATLTTGERVEFYSATIESEGYVRVLDAKGSPTWITRTAIVACGTSSKY